MPSRRYTVLIADRSTGVVRRFTVPFRPAVTTVAVVLALPVLIGLGARWSARALIADLQTENAALQVENASYRAATGELTTEIASLQDAVSALGERAKLDPAVARAMDRLPDLARTRAMGGGTPQPTVNTTLSSMVNSPENTFGMLKDLLGLLQNRLALMRDGVERRHALAAATPSIWPVAGWLSSGYGRRTDPFTGSPDFHPGLDISADAGQPVFATADGRVEAAGRNGNYGNLVVVNHGFAITTKYGHLSRIVAQPGDAIQRGRILGYVGSTGRSTGSHLHYEVWVNGRLVNPLRLLARR
jgi:murein DD-endopeptidase MepM/ murein hydrolase activator NlpD